MRPTRILVLAFALVWLFLVFRSEASAECIRVTPNLPQVFQGADVVFRGTLRNVEGTDAQALTFAVDNVWKGQVTRQFTVYQFPFVESYSFKPGIAYVMFAYLRKPDEGLKGIHRYDDPIFEIHTCGGPPWQPNLTELNKLARPRRPAP